MVVRNEDEIAASDAFQLQSWWCRPSKTVEAQGRAIVREHWVDKDFPPAQCQSKTRMADPGDSL